MNSIKVVSVILVAVLVSACQGMPKHRLHHRAVADSTIVEGSGTILLLPLNVEVREMSAGGLSDVVPSWTRDAKSNITLHLTSGKFSDLKNQTVVALPELTDEETATLDEHVSLAKVVWADAHILTTLGGAAWKHKATKFDYTLGPGLAFLAEKTGADKALIIIGEDMHTTTGRKAMFFAMAALGVAIPLGHTVMVGKLVDLKTGDLLWMNTWVDATGAATFLEPADVANASHALFEPYPGIEDYREFIKQSSD